MPSSRLPSNSGEAGSVQKVPHQDGWCCQIGRARNGTPLVFDRNSVTCAGGLMYSGYCGEHPPNFRYFLSSGKPGVVDGERYKRSPEIVDAWEKLIPEFSTLGKNLHVTRWDKLTKSDNPEVVVFFARPEVLSGLFSIANFDRGDPYGVVCPMGAECSSIIMYPWLEPQKDEPKVVLGMFDPSARKCGLSMSLQWPSR